MSLTANCNRNGKPISGDKSLAPAADPGKALRDGRGVLQCSGNYEAVAARDCGALCPVVAAQSLLEKNKNPGV